MAGRIGNPFDTAFPAPAKINRFLHVTGRRGDGYHELQTVFQFVDLCDDLRFSPLPRGRFEMESARTSFGEADLCLRAARLLAEHAGCPFGVRVSLTKRIPVGGGLGGGSSDAATTLVAINRLFGLGFPVERLAALGVKLGADVPVFVQGTAAWAEGVGERLIPVYPDTPWLLLVDPGVAVSTAEMFQASELTRDCPAERIADSGYEVLKNVFEPLVCRQYPAVREALEWFRGMGVAARLSGTGGCLFGLFPDEAAARAAQRDQPASWRSWVVRLLNRSPLCAWHPDRGADEIQELA